MKSGTKPLFSIGVTTYKRKEMLKECLNSIIRQTFSDFEVVVGNDCPEEKISIEELGIKDARVRLVNYTENIGEVANMNSLLKMSQGRYFTWFADDDMYAPTFLESIYASLVKFDFQPCVFTSYIMDTVFPGKEKIPTAVGNLLTGRQFLRGYLRRTVKTQGCYGVFDKEYIRRIGGIEQLGQGFSPYSDIQLAVRTGLLEKVVYIDAPLVFFRTHEKSISFTSPDIDAYSSSQMALLSKSVDVFRSERLSEDFHPNLFLLLRWCIKDIATVIHRSGSISRRQAIAYLLFIKRYISLLKGSSLYWRVIGLLARTALKLAIDIGKVKLNRVLRSSEDIM